MEVTPLKPKAAQTNHGFLKIMEFYFKSRNLEKNHAFCAKTSKNKLKTADLRPKSLKNTSFSLFFVQNGAIPSKLKLIQPKIMENGPKLPFYLIFGSKDSQINNNTINYSYFSIKINQKSRDIEDLRNLLQFTLFILNF